MSIELLVCIKHFECIFCPLRYTYSRVPMAYTCNLSYSGGSWFEASLGK
jgi:hypothetical protein